MKKLFRKIFIILIGFHFSCNSINESNEIKPHFLGNVKTITIKTSMEHIVEGKYIEYPSPLLKMKKTRNYDKTKLLTSTTIQFDSDITTVDFKYNSNNSIKQIIQKDKFGSISKNFVHLNDSTIEQYDNSENYLGKEITTDLGENLFISKRYDNKNILLSIDKIQEDSIRNILKSRSQIFKLGDTITETTVMKYSDFDETGNWLKRMTIVNDNIDTIQVQSRKIEYYEK